MTTASFDLNAAVTIDPPEISLPPRPGSRGGAQARRLTSALVSAGYLEEEYFIKGVATNFSPTSALGIDGEWSVEPRNDALYRTRALIYRPVDPNQFNGTLVLYWNNVTFGHDVIQQIVGGGFAFAALSVQAAGVDGFAGGPKGLRWWDPDRYQSLMHPGESFCYDIFTQAAKALGPRRWFSGLDPFEGMTVAKVIAMGASQSGMRLRTYVNAIDPREKILDGALLLIDFGLAIALDDIVLNRFDPTAPRQTWISAKVREDSNLPVLTISTEAEAMALFPARQPDTDRFRMWEIAGASHAPFAADDPSFLHQFAVETRDGEAMILPPDMSPPSAIPWAEVADAGLVAMQRWINGGPPPSLQPRLEFVGEPPQICRDELGLAKGGIRLPDVAAPLAANGAVHDDDPIISFTTMLGFSKPFDAETVKDLYANHEAYINAVDSAAQDLVRVGVLLPRHAAAAVERARHTPLFQPTA